MNENWNYGVLKDAVEKGSSNISLRKIKDEQGEYPVFGAKGFAKNVSFFDQENEYLALIKDGAGIGRVSKHPAKSSILATMQYIIPKDGFDIDFIRYFLESINFEEYRTGSTIPHIYFKDYKNARFPLIDLAEQKQIVTLLDSAFAKIDQAKANIEKNIANAKELFQSKLNEIFSQKGDGWEEKKLGEIVNISSGGTPSKKEPSFWDGHIPWVSPKDMKFLYIKNSQDKITPKALEQGKAKLLEIDTVLIVVRSGILSRTIPLGITKKKVTINQDLKALKTNSEILPQYFLNFLRANEPLLLAKVTRGATVHRIETPTLKQLKVLFPKKEKQFEINALVELLENKTDDSLNFYNQKIDNLEELKKSILQKAFAGELTQLSESGFIG